MNALNGKGIGINFVNVSGAATTLADIKVTDYTLEGTEFMGIVMLAELDDYGVTKEVGGTQLVYQWFDWQEEGEGGEMERFVGWFLDGEPADDTTLAIGDGLWMQSDTPTCKLQIAGQVYGQQLPIVLPSNVGKLCANPCPCDISINRITVSGYEREGTEFMGIVMLSELDEYGVTKEVEGVQMVYQWFDWDEEDGEDTVHYIGWFLDGNLIDNDVKLNMGEALWAQTDDMFTYTLTFPTAL